MNTFQKTPFLSEILNGDTIPIGTLSYFRERFRDRLYDLVMEEFLKQEAENGLTRAEVARRIGRRPEQITRWFGAPGNWTLETVSDLLLVIAKSEPEVTLWHLQGRGVRNDRGQPQPTGLSNGRPSAPTPRSAVGAHKELSARTGNAEVRQGRSRGSSGGISEVGMRLLAIEMSRITALFRMTRPRGQPYLPHIVDQVARRYSFVGTPRSVEELVASKVEFTLGLFEGNSIEKLEVYNDGIIVTARSDTDCIDRFIDDCIAWLERDHGCSVVETHTVNKMYNSTLLVETDRDVFKPFEAYAEILRMIERALQKSSSLEVAYNNFGLALSADQTRNTALQPVPFRFERKEGIDFSRHQFYTTAPLKTKQHLEILERLDQLT